MHSEHTVVGFKYIQLPEMYRTVSKKFMEFSKEYNLVTE